MKRKLLLWILNVLWRIQFKEVPYHGFKGYTCRECIGGDDFWCGEFYCPVEWKANSKLEWRFKSERYQKILKKWRTSIS